MLESDIEIGPVYHRLPDRIRAHAYIRFIALVLARVMRARLHEDPMPQIRSPKQALSVLRRIQTHRVTFEGQTSMAGISALDAEQAAVLASLKIKKPTAHVDYVNL